MRIAIVTGASSGMGRDFVYAVKEEYNPECIWLIARREDRLKEIAEGIDCPCEILPLDLTLSESIMTIKEKLENEKPVVSVLVNASGFGKFGKFEAVNLETQMNMIDLNDKALVAMTYITLPYMQRGSVIYQLCSLSSFQPVPYIGVYGATKAFVLSFSRAVNRELKSAGIRSMAVSPGWVKTEFFDRAVNDDTITYYNKFYTSEEVVKRAVRDMKKGKDVSICGLQVRIQVFFTKLLPHKLVMNIWCKQQKKK